MATTIKKLPSAECPWMKYYGQDWPDYPNISLYDFFRENNEKYPDDIAIIYLRKKIRYSELNQRIDACARALLSLGATRNDIITIALPSTPEAVCIIYAINKIGGVANMIHPLSSADEICFYLNEVKSKYFFLLDKTYSIVKDELNKTTVEKAIVVSPVEMMSPPIKALYRLKAKPEKVQENMIFTTWRQFKRLGKGTTPLQSMKADNNWAVITHTGGTTGSPKGVACTNSNYIYQTRNLIGNWDVRRQDVLLVHLPPFINYSLSALFESLSFGFKTVLIPEYEPMKLAEHIRRYNVTYIQSIPAYWESLLKKKKIGKKDFTTLVGGASGGERLDINTEIAINSVLLAGGAKNKLMKGMGMTETTSGVAGTFPGCNPLGCVGLPFPKTNCRIVDINTGDELSYNEEGEICFSGPTIMWGYYDNPEATADIIETDSDGTRWLHTGDIGHINEDGVIFLSGRLKRLIMQKDAHGIVSKIFPERIEETVNSHPAVNASCVIGIPDEARISRPLAIVEINKKTPENEKLKKDILQHCLEKLPDYMVPTEVIFVDNMPRTNRGKVDYRAVEQMVSGE